MKNLVAKGAGSGQAPSQNKGWVLYRLRIDMRAPESRSVGCPAETQKLGTDPWHKKRLLVITGANF